MTDAQLRNLKKWCAGSALIRWLSQVKMCIDIKNPEPSDGFTLFRSAS
jgi:hypothetical protein